MQSKSNNINSHSSCWKLSAPNYVGSQYPKRPINNLEPINQHADQQNPCLGIGIVDQDSASNQSTDQSLQSVSSEGNHKEQSLLAQSGNDDSYEKNADGQTKSMLSLRSTEVAFPPPKLDCNLSFGCLPYTYNNQLCGNFLPAYAPHAGIAHMMGTSPSSSIPLPHAQTKEESIYVNAKQYHAILRRREKRTKQEAQNKIIRAKKPYFHESRHVHAMKRVRGADGRFISTKELQKEAQNSAEDCNNSSNSSCLTCSEKSNLSSSGDKALYIDDQENYFGFADGSKELDCSGGSPR